jgi:hypothetical protein
LFLARCWQARELGRIAQVVTEIHKSRDSPC